MIIHGGSVRLRRFLLLQDFLTDVLHRIAAVGYGTAGATNSLVFPLEIENETGQRRGKVPLFQRSQTFLVPKKDAQPGNRSILRQRSLSGCPVSGSGPKSYGYRCQTPSMEIAPVQLLLDEQFTWPDRGFSISIWFQIHDDRLFSFTCKDPGSSAEITAKNLNTKMPPSPEDNAENFEDVMVFNLCSFGSLNALFEVWVGTNPRNLEYRYVSYSFFAFAGFLSKEMQI